MKRAKHFTCRILAVMMAGALTVSIFPMPAFGAGYDVDFGDIEGTSNIETVEVESGAADATNDETAYADTATSYTVTLDANGGYFENEWDDVLGEQAERAEVLNKVIPAGGIVSVMPVCGQGDRTAAFLGWSLERDGKIVWPVQEETVEQGQDEGIRQEQAGYTPEDSCVLYAVWSYEDAADEGVVSNDMAGEPAAESAAGDPFPAEGSDRGSNDVISEANENPTDASSENTVSGETEIPDAITPDAGEGYFEHVRDDVDKDEDKDKDEDDDASAVSCSSQAGDSTGSSNLESPGSEEENIAIEATADPVQESSRTATADPGQESFRTASQSADASNQDQLSGQCGPDAYWEVTDHVMTIHGTGEITSNPFDSYNTKENGLIKTVVIQDGITSLCDNSFNGAQVLEIILPDTIKDLGEGAFRSCTLMKIKKPDGIIELPNWAFYRCNFLREIELPESLETIGDYAFRECKRLEEIIIPSNVRRVGRMAFAYDDNLKRIVFTGDCPEFDEAGFGVFYHTYSEIYYPANNSTWDNEEGTGYHDISEIPLENAHVDTEKIDLGNVYYGFFDSVRYLTDFCKIEESEENEDGTIIYSTVFGVNQSASWLDNVTFTIKDVTPPAYKKAFQELIVPGLQERELKIKSQKTYSNPVSYFGFEPDIERPYTGTPESTVTGSMKSLIAIKIETNRLVRVIRIDAIKNGNVLDTEYLISRGLNNNCETLKSDEDLYKAARLNAEAQLWTQDMTVPEKIAAIAAYIGSTTHYPGEISCTREANPKLWEAMGVEGQFLFYYGAGNVLVNRIMAFQGGLISCVAADILETIASDDLGIRHLDQDTCKTTTGEACWIGMGSESSNPSNASHVTFYYRDANDRIYPFDVQGRGTGTYDADQLIHFSDCTVENGFYHYVENVCTPIEDAVVTGISAKTYTGKAITQTPVVTLGSTTLNPDTDYTVTYSNNTNAGTATLIFTGKGSYSGTRTETFKINKADQSITANSDVSSIAAGRTARVSVTGNKGTKSYKSSNTAIATVDTKTGVVTAKKVGTVTITATSDATSNYNAASKKLTIKVVPAATSSITAASQVTGIKLTWKKVPGATGYRVYRGSTLIKTIKSGSTVTYTDIKANTNGTKYVYKVIPTATTGNGPAKSLTTYRVARPAISSVKNDAAKRITVKWSKNAKATGYQIQYSTSKSFGSENTSALKTKAATVSKVIGKLTKGKTYYVRIRTYKTAGKTQYWSTWSPVKTIKINK